MQRREYEELLQRIRALERRVGTVATGGGGGGGTGLNQLTGDVTAGPGTGSQAATIANDAVTYAKIQNISAASRLLGRGSAAGSGDTQEISLGANLSMAGTTLNAVGSGGGGGIVSVDDFYFDDGANKWIAAFGPVTPPVNGDFTWINQGGASVDTTFGGVYLLAPATNTVNWRIRKKAAPAAPYTITASFLVPYFTPDFVQFGLLFRQSSDGKLTTLSIQRNTLLKVDIHRYTDATTFSGTTLLAELASPGNLVWLQISDNNTNRISRVSPDGVHWIDIFSEGRTTYMTADEVAFGAMSQNGTYDFGVTLLSWDET